MIFFDTNILVYSSINQDTEKQMVADQAILLALKNHELCISPLVLTEYLFVLAKLKQIEIQQKNIVFFKSLAMGVIDTKLVNEAYKICSQASCCKSINDVIHLKFAENYCSKLMTFDGDFEKLKPYTPLQIEILA